MTLAPPLSRAAQEAVEVSRLAAGSRGEGWSSAHIVLAILDAAGDESGGFVGLVADLPMLRRRLADVAGRAVTAPVGRLLRPDRVLAAAAEEAILAGGDAIENAHLLLAAVESAGELGELLAEHGLSEVIVRNPEAALLRRMESWRSPFSHWPTLAAFGQDLTEQARNGALDPVIGREAEMERLIQILNRRVKNTPVLVGYPGVGKTAIVEGLAQRIAAGRVPARMRFTRIVTLDLANLVAGARSRGQFEERLQGVLHELRQAQGGLVLFIDEFHTIVGAGASEGGFDFANMVKPALASGALRVIGATTPDEYRRSIERDAALERRLTPVWISEPSTAEAVAIMRGLAPRLAQHHGLTIADEALTAAVRLSLRYLTGRHLPDKAIDLIDEAASRVALKAGAGVALDPAVLLARLDKETVAAAPAINGTGADAYRRAYRHRLYEKAAAHQARLIVTQEDVAALVASMTGIPMARVLERESERLLRLEGQLHRRVVGQQRAISVLSDAIRRSRAGLGDPRRPIGSFIFLGPSGVGKTELSHALAEALFDDPDALIRLDMSEYMERHNVSRLFGAPPGYVGYEDAGTLSELVRRRPYQVILFDEIEKAHPEVFNVLLQILDAGRLTDGHGRIVDFRNTVVIMTSNVGTGDEVDIRHVQKSDDGVFDQEWLESQVEDALRRTFRPEFRNRIDEIVVFEPLSRRELRQIVDLQLADLRTALALRGLTLSLTPMARDALVQEGFNPVFGARPLRRAIQTRVMNPLALRLLRHDSRAGRVVVGYHKGRYTISVRPAAPPTDAESPGDTVPDSSMPAPPQSVEAAVHAAAETAEIRASYFI